MRLTQWTIALIGVWSFAELPTWHLARAPGTGCWPPQCQSDQIPLATPVVAHSRRLYMIGDGAAPNQIYQSDDGINWRSYSHDASRRRPVPCDCRTDQKCLVFRDFIAGFGMETFVALSVFVGSPAPKHCRLIV